ALGHVRNAIAVRVDQQGGRQLGHHRGALPFAGHHRLHHGPGVVVAVSIAVGVEGEQAPDDLITVAQVVGIRVREAGVGPRVPAPAREVHLVLVAEPVSIAVAERAADGVAAGGADPLRRRVGVGGPPGVRP
ncbi:MAG: hypothetical protein ACK559_12825, partial [bacterium]